MASSSSAVTVIEQSPDAVVEYNLDNWPESEWNRLVPTQTLGLATDLIRPIVQAVRLDVERDTYKSNDIPEGFRAPNARGLSKLAAAAGVDFVDEVRLDDGSDPGRAYVRVYAEMIDATGRKRRAPGSRDYVLDSQSMTDPQRRRAKGFVHEHAATRARHRALRALLSLPQAYTIAELNKPFAVVSFVPNLQNPELRSRVMDAMVPTIAALYGSDSAKQLAAPAAIEVAEISDDEIKNVTPPPGNPTVIPGEKLAKADAEEPAWLQPAAKATATAAPKKPFVDVVRSTAADADDGEALATPDDLKNLGAIFAGYDQALVTTGIRTLWPEQDDEHHTIAISRPSIGQARAIAKVHETLGHEDFEREWTAMSRAVTA